MIAPLLFVIPSASWLSCCLTPYGQSKCVAEMSDTGLHRTMLAAGSDLIKHAILPVPTKYGPRARWGNGPPVW
jgi:hypothetical protein